MDLRFDFKDESGLDANEDDGNLRSFNDKYVEWLEEQCESLHYDALNNLEY